MAPLHALLFQAVHQPELLKLQSYEMEGRAISAKA
jgi:hypothetical protein